MVEEAENRLHLQKALMVALAGRVTRKPRVARGTSAPVEPTVA